MKTHCLPLAAVLAIALSPLAATAQASAPLSAASTPRAAKPGPRVLSPAEKRDNATEPGELRPERAVTPQVRVPLSKRTPARPTLESRALRRGATSTGGVDDAAARCDALSGEARAACRDRLIPKAGSSPGS